MLHDLPLGFITPGPVEMMVLAVIAVLLFGKRLPEVGRSVGKGISEFKKGITDAGSGARESASVEPESSDISAPAVEDDDRRQAPSAPRFEPPTEQDQGVEETATAG